MVLGVNIDHIATLRQARMGADPDPLMAAPLVLLGGADGITVHLREDRRHINDRDLRLLKETVPVEVELNLEMAPTSEMLRIACALKPDMATLVPEKRAELTTEGGLGLKRQNKKLQDAIKKLHKAKIPVSLFINPDTADVDVSRALGADMVEIHTGRYADALTPKAREREFRRVLRAVEHGLESGITVNAGHGLNYYNVKPVAAINGVRGLYIGHSIISRAVLVGLERAVMEMKALISEVAL